MIRPKMEEDNYSVILVLLLLLFLYNLLKFINLPQSELPILSSLFGMIIFLAILVFILHKKDFLRKKTMYRQERLDKYLKKEN